MTDFLPKNRTQDIIHMEVCWLSKGNFLARFVNLFGSIVNFLENVGRKNLADEIGHHKCDIYFLACFFFVSSMKFHSRSKVNYAYC